MILWYPKKIREHDKSCVRFSAKFNNSPPFYIKMNPQPDHRFDNDGDISCGKNTINFDWEKRTDWNEGPFPYPTLGQFGRKFGPNSNIHLSIQSNNDETHFAVAWQDDFGEDIPIRSRKASGKCEINSVMRETDNFKIFKYGEMEDFKRSLFRLGVAKGFFKP